MHIAEPESISNLITWLYHELENFVKLIFLERTIILLT